MRHDESALLTARHSKITAQTAIPMTKHSSASEEHFFANLLNSMYWFDDAFQVNLESMGLERTSRVESFVLLNISAGEQRAIEIAKNIGVTRQAISQILKDFEERGWIAVTADPTDGRARIVNFSESFAERGEMCSQIIRGIVRELEDRIGKSMVDTLRVALASEWGDPPRLNLNFASSKVDETPRETRPALAARGAGRPRSEASSCSTTAPGLGKGATARS